ncbi:MAG: hypothetical protein K0S47_1822 [Herbinix sp.]|jgi:hypothetical protein|nr:hypothetical protein [Herbinix sp.]
MFGLYFGNYLLEKNKISQSQLKDVMKQHSNSRVKLGLIAISEKLMTAKQAEEINQLQKQLDKRFGDIAIEKGYLIAEEVTHLLNLQGNPYLQFVQSLIDLQIMTFAEIEQCLEAFKKEYHLSDTDLEAIKTGDIDSIIPVFADVNAPFIGDIISLSIRNIVRFIHHQIIIKKSYKSSEYEFTNIAFQELYGDHKLFVGLASKKDELLAIAEPYAKETFPRMEVDAFDSVCEFINCTNGLYASSVSMEDINLELVPPQFYGNQNRKVYGNFTIVPFFLTGNQVDLIVAHNNDVKID